MSCLADNKIAFNIIKGDDICFKIDVINENTDKSMDITGWSIITSMKLNPMEEDNALYSLKVVNKYLKGDDAEKGVCYIYLPSDKTEKLLPATYFLDIERQLRGRKSTVLQTRVKVINDVTKGGI